LHIARETAGRRNGCPAGTDGDAGLLESAQAVAGIDKDICLASFSVQYAKNFIDLKEFRAKAINHAGVRGVRQGLDCPGCFLAVALAGRRA
jgi:hypothetical protein